jgi:hypothetical protein
MNGAHPANHAAAPLVVGPLRGYRYWCAEWEEGQPVLRSLYHSTRWPVQGPLHATCEKRPSTFGAWIRHLVSSQPEETHAAPAGVCNCGIYALTQWDAIEPQALLPPVCHHPGLERYVFGLVLLWGRVIQHGHGYRAEYARPLRLLTTSLRARSDGIRSLLDAVTTCYGIPLVTRVEELSAPFREG